MARPSTGVHDAVDNAAYRVTVDPVAGPGWPALATHCLVCWTGRAFREMLCFMKQPGEPNQDRFSDDELRNLLIGVGRQIHGREPSDVERERIETAIEQRNANSSNSS